MLARHDIRAILCARGGYGAMRILCSRDWRAIAHSPIHFCGFSDITALHLMLLQFGWTTIHGPNVTTLGRLGVVLDAQSGAIKQWPYKGEQSTGSGQEPADAPQSSPSGFVLTGKETVLRAPVTEALVRDFKVGDLVLISGELYTGRDAVHAHPVDRQEPGPVCLRE